MEDPKDLERESTRYIEARFRASSARSRERRALEPIRRRRRLMLYATFDVALLALVIYFAERNL